MKYRINAGKYRQPITIQKRDVAQNSYGESMETWVDVIKTRAGIFPMTGSEKFAGDQFNSEITHKIHFRYVKNITPDCRILFQGRVFNITSIVNLTEKNVELQLYCKEIVS